VEIFESDEKIGVERREHQRHAIPAAVTCRFFEEVLRGKGTFQGFIQDISFGGVALEIRDDFLTIKESLLLYTTLEMTVAFNLSDGIHQMDFSGIIRWYKRIKRSDKSFVYIGRSDKSFVYIGIKFHSLNEESKEVLKHYLSLGTGDTNLIWNLWDNLSIQP
jgi:hypothetical protein